MSNISQSSGQENKPPVYLFPSTADNMQSKIGTILGILKTVQPFVLTEDNSYYSYGSDDDEEWKQGEGKSIDGEVGMAAEVTAINAFERLDRILKEDSHWEMAKAEVNARKRVRELHSIELNLQKTRLDSMTHVNRPSVRNGAKVYRVGSQFVAVLGDFNDSAHNISGAMAPNFLGALDNLDSILNSMTAASSNET